jgi:hypothetical protein
MLINIPCNLIQVFNLNPLKYFIPKLLRLIINYKNFAIIIVIIVQNDFSTKLFLNQNYYFSCTVYFYIF